MRQLEAFGRIDNLLTDMQKRARAYTRTKLLRYRMSPNISLTTPWHKMKALRGGPGSKRRFGRIFKIIVTMILISISLPVVSSAQLDTIYCHFGLMPHQISNRYEFHFLIANGSLSSKGIEVLLFHLSQLTI